MADRKEKFSLRKIISNDKYLIIVSILLALLVWTVTSLNIGTDETRTISLEVPIKLSDEMSEQIGMQYYTLQDTVTLNVTVSGAKYVVGQVDEDDLNIKFDTSNVNRAGEQSIPILVTNKSNTLDFTVVNTYPASIEAYFDVNETKTFDLYLSYDDTNVAEGYVFGTPVINTDKVIISGPKTYVDRIERASVNVDFGEETALTKPYNTVCNIDIDGSGVESSYLRITSRTDTETPITTVDVTLPVLKETNLPVSVQFEDRPEGVADDVLSVKYSVNSLHVGILDGADIESAVVGTIRFNQLKAGENTFEFDANSIQGVTLLDSDIKKIAVTVTVSSDYIEHIVVIDPANVKVEGAPDGYTAMVTSVDYTNVSVIAPKSFTPNAANITMKCDISEQNDKSVYPITMTLSDNSSWIYYTYYATVELTQN